MTTRKEPANAPANAYVQRVHDDTRRCLTELKSHNERLRLHVAALESDRNRLAQEKLRLQEQLMDAREGNSRVHEEHESLLRRLSEVELENERVSAQFLDIETQNTNLANLYVASYQLRASLDREQIMSAIKEILVNLIGSEDFAIFEKVEGAERLELVDWFNHAPHIVREVRFGEGIIGTVASSGESFIATDDRARVCGMTACIPLKVDDRVTGAIAVFRLLPQKENALDTLDHELLDLLATQAGIALHCTRLHRLATEREAASSGAASL
jgi:regulator of replication initiation timing